MKKFLAVFFSIFGFLVGTLALIWLGLDVSKYILYEDFMDNKTDVCTIPDLNEGFTPQGITYLEAENAYLHSGYNGKFMEVHYVRGEESRRLLPLNEDGEHATGHGGGITAYGDYAYLAGSKALLVYRLTDILAAKDGDSLPCVMKIEVDNSASFCFASEDGLMYVGEFYRAGNYETDPEHHLTTKNGTENHAIVSCYPIKEDGSLTKKPRFWISVPDQVQGFAVKDGIAVVSRSWGLNSSSLEFYDLFSSSVYVSQNLLSSSLFPIFYLDSGNLIKQVDMPAFSEDLDLKGDQVLISFESACNKYVIGKLFFAYEASVYPFPKFDATPNPIPKSVLS